MNLVEPFSDRYYVVNAAVEPADTDEAAVSPELFEILTEFEAEPVLRLGNTHHWPARDNDLAIGTVEAPDDTVRGDEPPLMLRGER
jgi:hypothetical protein